MTKLQLRTTEMFDDVQDIKIYELNEIYNLPFKIDTMRIIKINEKEYMVDYCDLLVEVLKCENYKDALQLLKLTDSIFIDIDDKYDEVYLAIRQELFKKFKINEFYYQRLFKKVAYKMGYKVVSYKNNKKDIPDVWVKDNDDLIPVEVKLGAFNKSALTQLQRYIKVYNCCKGIAIGKTLTVSLPNNIKFISTDLIDVLKEK